MTKKSLTKEEILDILDNMGMLGDIRQRLGAKDEQDTSKDMSIMGLNAENLVAKYTGWNLGDERWATNIIYYYENLKKKGL